ncbi:MAG: DNA polymerase III subunit gamma/tau [Myxococcaceae bacterium]|nr:MAG: DNA polymerase III subunit gamma/tau [Myxococcaceae bacterium]
MSYLVLARKWRPQTFADLVGQEHVVQTLHNAITQDRLSHAFLFTGARGVGKTTIARILARSLNCLASDRVTATPCLKCSACLEIADGRDPDVQEIDGASNNGVDDVRRLQETLPYRPLRDRYKVVIIDECHMVSTNGWNALLKTLEEPPPHVKFIFATTEVHKVIPTILSRVQRYDFRLLPTKQIRDRVAYILTQEGIRFDEDAVMLVAREAAGSLRDALTFLDQVLAGVEGELTGVAASRLLGIANRGLLDTLVRAMLTGDASAALETVGMFAREGFDLPNAARRVLGVLRDLVVARVAKDPDALLDLVDEERAQAMDLAKQHDPADLQRLFTAWAKVTEDVSRAREPRWVLEMAAVRLASRPTLVPVEELMAKLVEMERRVAAGAAAPGSAPARPSSGGAGPTGGGAPTPTVQRPAPTVGAPAGGAPKFSPPRMSTAAAAAAPEMAPAPVTAAVRPVPAPPPPKVLIQNTPRVSQAPRPTEAAESAPVVASAPVVTVDVSGAMGAMDAWRRVVDAVDKTLVPVLKGAVPLEVSGEAVRLAIDLRDSFFRKKLATEEAQAVILEAASRVFGTRPTMELVQGTLPDDAPSIARLEELARQAERAAKEAVLRAHPLVQIVVEMLHGEVAKVKLEGDPD